MPQGMKGERRRDINLYAKTEKKKKRESTREKRKKRSDRLSTTPASPFFFFVVLTKYTNNQTKREKRETEVGRNNTERDLSIKDWYDINHVNQENGEKGGGNRLITPGNADAEEKGEKQELIYSSFFFFLFFF